MPTFRNINVSVVTQDNQALPEYGVKYIRKSDECWCYIESKSQLSFKIGIRADQPYPYEQNEPLPPSQRKFSSRLSQQPSLRDSLHRPTRSLSGPSYQYSPKPPSFSFLASVYLDGRSKPERRTVVYLDPHNEWYKNPAELSSRWVQHGKGDIRAHKWVFKDVLGIETMLDKLFIDGDLPIQGILNNKEEDDLVAALNAATIKVGEMEEQQESAIGCIKVTLQRITLGEVAHDRSYRANHQLYDKDDASMGNLNGHVAAFMDQGEIMPDPAREPMKIIEYYPYRKDEKMFATFKFFYRSKDVLRKFSFPELAVEKKQILNQRKVFEKQMINLTPLSISNSSKVDDSLSRPFNMDLKTRGEKDKDAQGIKAIPTKDSTLLQPQHDSPKTKKFSPNNKEGDNMDEVEMDLSSGSESDLGISKRLDMSCMPKTPKVTPRVFGKINFADLHASTKKLISKPSTYRDRASDADDEATGVDSDFTPQGASQRYPILFPDSGDDSTGVTGLDKDDHGIGSELGKLDIKKRRYDDESSGDDKTITSESQASVKKARGVRSSPASGQIAQFEQHVHNNKEHGQSRDVIEPGNRPRMTLPASTIFSKEGAVNGVSDIDDSAPTAIPDAKDRPEMEASEAPKMHLMPKHAQRYMHSMRSELSSDGYAGDREDNESGRE